MPRLARMQRELSGTGLQVVMATSEPAEALRAAPDWLVPGITYLVGATDLFRRYGIEAVPRTIYFAPDGGVAAEIDGYDPDALGRIEQSLRALRSARQPE